jgi:hypothetical protein
MQCWGRLEARRLVYHGQPPTQPRRRSHGNASLASERFAAPVRATEKRAQIEADRDAINELSQPRLTLLNEHLR